jgi:hypothetical protein
MMNKLFAGIYPRRIAILASLVVTFGVLGLLSAQVPLLSTAIILGIVLLFLGVFIWTKPTTVLVILMILLPFQSLAMRVLQVEMGLSDNMILFISMWKEFVLLVLILRSIQSGWIRVNSIDVLIVLYALLSFAYVFVSDGLLIGLYGFRGAVEPFAFYFLARKASITPTGLKRVLKYLFIVATVVTIFGFVQAYVLGEPFLWKYKAEEHVLSSSHTARVTGRLIIRASSTFTSPNHLGMYLAILVLLGIGILNEQKLTRKEIAVIGAFVVGLLISLSRSAWLALLVGFFSMFGLRRRIKKRMLVAMIVLALLVLPAAIHFNVFERVIETISFEDPSAAGKLPSILNGVKFVLQNPLGIGTGMAGPRSSRFGDILEYHAENFYVLMAMEIGVVGLFLYLALMWMVVLQLRRCYFQVRDPLYKGVTLGTLAAVMGASTGAMFIPSLQEIVVAAFIWFFIGISFRARSLESKTLVRHPPVSANDPNSGADV